MPEPKKPATPKDLGKQVEVFAERLKFLGDLLGLQDEIYEMVESGAAVLEYNSEGKLVASPFGVE